MRLHKLRFRGIGMPFRSSEVSIDFDALPQGLIALVGDNGSGKSHILELSGAATLFRELASYQESLTDHVPPGVRDAFSELEFSLGADSWRALTQSDPQFGGNRGKNEAYLMRLDGAAWTPVAGPLVRDYDAAIAKIVAPKELFLASVFACQGGGGSFFGLAKAARKDLFGSMLGLGHLQVQAEAARSWVTYYLQAIEGLRKDIETAEARRVRIYTLGSVIDRKSEELAALDAKVAKARALLQEAQAELAAAKEALARAEAEAGATERDRERIEGEKARAQQQVGALTARLEQIDEVLAGAAEVRAAPAQLAEIDALIQAKRDSIAAAQEELRPIEKELGDLEAKRASLLADRKSLAAELELALAAGLRVDAASSLEQQMVEKRETLAFLDEKIAENDDEVESVESAANAEAAQISRRLRLEARRTDLAPRKSLLDQIPGVPECARCPLTENARDAAAELKLVEADIADLPAIVGTPAQDARQAHQALRRELEVRRAAAQRWIAENAPKVERLAIDTAEALKIDDLTDAVGDIADRERDVAAKLDDLTGLRGDRQLSIAIRKENDLPELEAKRSPIWVRTQRVEKIAAAEAQRAEVEIALASAKIDAIEAAKRLAALPGHDLAGPRADVDRATQLDGERALVLRGHEERAAETRDEIARLTGERAALGDPEADLVALRAQESAHVTEAADWALLERALGRDGIQALAIDAAGPTVSAIANDLLSACYGPRFSLSLETTAMTKDGKKQKEVFDLRIIDAEAGREARQGSKGEMVLIDEALRLALAIFNVQRSGVPLRTLWRDETTGALSPEKADRYIAMLRRAMELGGFERCLLVAHQAEVWEQADARIFVANGQATIDDQRAAA